MAPANISAAEAVPSSINTTNLTRSRQPPSVDFEISASLFLLFVETITSPLARNSSAMFIAASITPPGFPLKSNTNLFMPWLNKDSAATTNSSWVGTEN